MTQTQTSVSLATCGYDSPLGTLTLVANDEALLAIQWESDDREMADDADDHAVLNIARAQLDEYFAGQRTQFDIPLEPHGTEFQLATWAVLRTIPFGHTISYGEQARRLGDPAKARAVGAANGRNPLPIVVPCHRVVGASGHLTGFTGGLDIKRWLLQFESQQVPA